MKTLKNQWRIGIVISKFNEEITTHLYKRCCEELARHKIQKKQLKAVWVPGAYEIPFMAKKLVDSKKFDAVIALGCIIKGDTSHDVHIATWAANGIGQVSLSSNVPVMFGVLTPNTEQQALKRVKPGPLNRGKEIALATIQMIQLSQEKV